MKVDLKLIARIGISPNSLYLLYCCKEKLTPAWINIDQETAWLEGKGYILADGSLTMQGEDVLARASYMSKSKTKTKHKLTDQELPYVQKYRSLFPAGQLPSGADARSSVAVLTGRLEVFFSKHPEYKDWNTVLQATALYLDEAERRNWEFTQSSENFIYKNDLYKNWNSTLAKYCERIQQGALEQTTSAGPSIIHIPGLTG